MQHLSFTGKRWTAPEHTFSGDAAAIALSFAQARFLGDDSVRAWTDSSTYPMAAAAAERLKKAASTHETVGIIGDYDCDGVTSTAILVRLLRRLGIEPIVRLPHRLKEGYGVQQAHITEMHAHGVTLLITTDTGITAINPLAHARMLGIDVIVIDHHAFVDMPPAFAVLHPSLTTLRSPPAAAGVAFAFAHAVEGTPWADMDTDAALAAIGTVGDVVPLTHENRIMVQEGLAALARLDASSGLGMLRNRSGIGPVPTSGDIAFRLSPRLNAAGRLDDATLSLQALLGDAACIDQLDALNSERQRLTQECMEEAFGMLDIHNLPACICIASERFPKGIIGLIAGKLTERFGRPSAVITIKDGYCTASLRGIPGHDIAGALRAHAQLFTTFGGHAQAGGCSFPLTHIDAIQRALHDDVLSYIREDALQPTITIDLALPIERVTIQLVEALAELEPFGAGNREPIFLIPSVALTTIRRVGSDQQHLQARVGDMGIIGFGLGEYAAALTGTVDLACRITVNEWNGRRNVQLSVVDVRTTTARNEE